MSARSNDQPWCFQAHLIMKRKKERKEFFLKKPGAKKIGYLSYALKLISLLNVH